MNVLQRTPKYLYKSYFVHVLVEPKSLDSQVVIPQQVILPLLIAHENGSQADKGSKNVRKPKQERC